MSGKTTRKGPGGPDMRGAKCAVRIEIAGPGELILECSEGETLEGKEAIVTVVPQGQELSLRVKDGVLRHWRFVDSGATFEENGKPFEITVTKDVSIIAEFVTPQASEKRSSQYARDFAKRFST